MFSTQSDNCIFICQYLSIFLISYLYLLLNWIAHQQQTTFENIVEKEEIARNEQFLLFPQCFLLSQKIEKEKPKNWYVKLRVKLSDCQFEVCQSLSPYFLAFVEDNVTMSSIPYFEKHVRYFVQNRRKYTLLTSISV